MIKRDIGEQKAAFPCFLILMLLTFFKCFTTISVLRDFHRSTGIITGRKTISANIISNQTTGSPIIYQYTQTYTDRGPISPFPLLYPTLTGNLKVGLAISGFIAYNNTEWSPQIKVVSVSSTQLTYAAQVLGNSYMTMFGVDYIVMSNQFTYGELHTGCFTTTNLNSGTGYRIQYRNQTTAFYRSNLKVAVFIYGFELFHHNSENSFLKATVLIKNYSQIIEYSFATNEYNTVDSICYTTIIFDEIGTQTSYLDIGQINSYSLSDATSPSTIILEPAFKYYNRMFFGVSSFNLSNLNYQLKFAFMSTEDFNNLAYNYATNNGTWDVIISAFYIAYRICDSTTYIYYNPADWACYTTCPLFSLYQVTPENYCSPCRYSCLSCSGGYSCSSCDSANHFRVATPVSGQCDCLSGYIDIGQSICMQCKIYLAGCSQCSSPTVCDTCSLGFVKNGNQCMCSSGRMVSGVCTTLIGCENIKLSATNVQQCIQCNTNLGYVLLNYQCICASGYISDGTSCKSSCGDGLIAYDEECDDSNTDNDDGCSSQCKIETDWACKNQPSICKLNINPQMTIRYVSRIVSSNTMLVSISLNPNHKKFQELYLKSYFTHNIPSSDWKVSYQHPGVLTMQFDYSQSIQGNNYNLNFTTPSSLFDPTSSSKLQIPATGMNAKLTYDKYQSHTLPLQIIIYIIDGLAVLVFIVGIFIQKFIAIEMIQTIQFPLYMMALISNCPSTYSPLQKLRYSNGYNYVTGQDKARTYPYLNRISAIGVEKDFLLNFNVMYGILIITMILSVICKIAHHFIKKRLISVDKTQEFCSELLIYESYARKSFKIVFQNVLIALIIFSMYQVIFSMMIMANPSIQPRYNLISIYVDIPASIIAGVIIGVGIIILLTNYIATKLKLLTFYFSSRAYPALYILVNFLLIVLISIGYLYFWMIFVVMLVLVCKIIFLIAVRPYPNVLQNVCIIFNQLVLIYTAGLYIAGQYTSDNKNNLQILYLVGFYFLVFLVLIVIMSTLVRFYFWRSFYKQYIKKQQFLQDTYKDKNYHEQERELVEMKRQNQDFEWDINSIHSKRAAPLNLSKMPKDISQLSQGEQFLNVDPLKLVKQKLREDLLRKKNQS